MAAICAEVYMVLSDPANNNNKFYRMTLTVDGTLTYNWGRVGTSGQTKVEQHCTTADLERTRHAKERKGYRVVNVAGTTAGARQATSTTLAQAAKREMQTDAADVEVAKLLERLAACNRHAIASLSGGRINVQNDGKVKTDLGILIGRDALCVARQLLSQIAAATPTDSSWNRLVGDYLSTVPQKVGSRRGWDVAMFTGDAIDKQVELLDALDAAVTSQAQAADADDEPKVRVGFRYTIRRVTDEATINEISKLYVDGANRAHGRAAALRVRAVYALTDDAEHTAQFERLKRESFNVRRMWHGSQASNLLSILKSGLVVPGQSGLKVATHGQMFGPGVYGSPVFRNDGKDQTVNPSGSTKAAAYACGNWGGTDARHGVFCFLADFVMGWEYRSSAFGDWRGSRSSKNPKGEDWNSISVRGGDSGSRSTAGVMNDECVVWDTTRVSLSYLVELA